MPEPTSDDVALLERLGVGHDDAVDIAGSLPSGGDERLRAWVLAGATRALTAPLPYAVYRWWPLWPRPERTAWRWFYAQLFLRATPSIRRWHLRHGVDDTVSWETLADVGRLVDLYRLKHPDRPQGLDDPRWLVHHYRGRLFQLGRLQFLRGRSDLEVHIPAGGPLVPEAVDASLDRARTFFDRHSALCQSWLLDPQLAEYLPPTSNIVRFQRRFRLDDGWKRKADRTIVEFVFHRRDVPLAELPQDTTLERAVVAHLTAGRHWQVRRGWCDLSG